MPGEESWLIVKVSKKDPLRSKKKALFRGERSRGSTFAHHDPEHRRMGRTALFISVPKKLVPLSTRRNRLRRLIREAVRKNPFFSAAGTLYEFKVTASPRDPGLGEVKAVLENIKMGFSKGLS